MLVDGPLRRRVVGVDHGVCGDAVQGRGCAVADHGDGHGYVEGRDRVDERHELHVQGRRDQQRRHWCGVACFGGGDPRRSRTNGEPSFVVAAYTDFLGRAPTPTELSTWTAKLDAGASRDSLVSTLANSHEWVSAIVTQLYLNTLGRQPDTSRSELLDRSDHLGKDQRCGHRGVALRLGRVLRRHRALGPRHLDQ